MTPSSDAELVEIFLTPIRKCANYKPAFGQGSTSKGLRVSEFKALYNADQFYAWLGLDTALVYAAHKAAGGLTSVYRQIGVGSERLFRGVISRSLQLSEVQLKWSYEYEKSRNKKGVHTLDAQIIVADLALDSRRRMEEWLKSAVPKNTTTAKLSGAVFEVRQGYKSADSKRQNADLRYGIHAYQAGLLPVFAVMSAQVSEPVIRRYRQDGMVILRGTLSTDATISTFAFFKDVIAYDLAAFFERNSAQIRTEINVVVEALLTP